MSWYMRWKPYVPVAKRRQQAQRQMQALRKKGSDVQPVVIEGRDIAQTFWGEAWCDHLETFSDFENRLPRGRSYVRNGSVCHLAIAKGGVEARVSGSELYTVKVTIKPLAGKKWQAIKKGCTGHIGSLLELLQGRLSDQVMTVVTDRSQGLFPLPGEMSFQCSCPDWADMCKHVAAVLYGVGARLDTRPELLFVLRGVNHEELIAADAEQAVAAATSRGKSRRLAAGEVGSVFGIELDAAPSTPAALPADTAAADVADGTRRQRRPRKQAKPGGRRLDSAEGPPPRKTRAKASAAKAKKTVKRKPRKPAS